MLKVVSNYSSYQMTKRFTKQEIEEFGRLTGDLNPVHVESESNPKPIVHGVLLEGAVSAIMGMFCPGPGTVLISKETKFLKPTYVDSIVTINVEIADDKRIKLCKFECKDEAGTVLMQGTANVLKKASRRVKT